MLSRDAKETLKEKPRWELSKNAGYHFEKSRSNAAGNSCTAPYLPSQKLYN